MALSNLRIHLTWKNLYKEYRNNKFIILTLVWNDEIELSDRSCSVGGIQDYLKILKRWSTTK